jgi:hypothetical protein
MRPVPCPEGSHEPVGRAPAIRHDVPPFVVVVKYEFLSDVKFLFQKVAMATPFDAENI